jgi:hypothetical protein
MDVFAMLGSIATVSTAEDKSTTTSPLLQPGTHTVQVEGTKAPDVFGAM